MLVSYTKEFSYFRKKLCLEVMIELLKENICNTIIAGLYFVRHGKTEFLAVAESARIPYSTLSSNLKCSTENSKCFFTLVQKSESKDWIKSLCVSKEKQNLETKARKWVNESEGYERVNAKALKMKNKSWCRLVERLL